jgi:DNA-binding beta-propeller fold protein YncE
MKLTLIYLSLLCFLTNCKGQNSFGAEKLKFLKEIPLRGVKGRIDHMAVNLKDHMLYVAALVNNTVEVVDLNKGSVVHSIKGIEEPQGLAYLPGQNELAVASGGNGDCIFLNASTFEKVAAVHLGSDADNIRYDPGEKKVYVGYGNGGIALLDPATHKQLRNVKLPAHPESFQLDQKSHLLFANLPDDHSIAVIDLKNLTLTDTWKPKGLSANFPMTLDTAHNLVMVGYRHPAVLVAYDSKTGRQTRKADLTGDSDDLFYDAGKKQVIASGGEGYINVFETGEDNHFKLVANIATRQGARTSLLIPSLHYFVVAARAQGGKNASVILYQAAD